MSLRPTRDLRMEVPNVRVERSGVMKLIAPDKGFTQDRSKRLSR